MKKLRVLVLDIETAPLVAYVWDRRDQNIGLNQLKTDWYVLAWAAKWLDEPASKIIYMDQRHSKNKQNDKAILLPLWKLLNEADKVITQNGKNFDSPKINARFILNGMNPPSPYKHLDTYQIVRRVAKFTSASLEYLTDKLCTKYKKLSHKRFPGMSLWAECLAGNKIAWDEMKRYNVHDVLATEELYHKIKVWDTSPQHGIYHVDSETKECVVCGKGRLIKRGFKISKKGNFQQLQCSECGSWRLGDKVK